ncbi:MAG: 16S rRNA (cytosine(1402)-N(4))-methyltransferase RsmH [Gemmataceae bacterium]|mgnify:CR=1 FL=1
MSSARHVPVMVAEVLHWLDPRPGETALDMTCGAGGHAQAIAVRLGADGCLVLLDRDPSMLAIARRRHYPCRVHFVQGNYDRAGEVLSQLGIRTVQRVLADLGFASDQMDDPARGFSFQHEGPLDMRYDPSQPLTAADLVNQLPERELADVFWRYGQERHSRAIARQIVRVRQRSPLCTTTQLAELVRSVVPRRGRIDPATRVFQALRIAVNDELGALERMLRDLPALVEPGGRAVVISFHSLEDRLVKRAFRDRAHWQVLTRKPVTPSDTEKSLNPRSRSARLRAARRVAERVQDPT